MTKKLTVKIDLNYLICSLYTLSEYHILFKELNLKNTMFLNTNDDENYIETIGKLYKLLNSSSLRRFSIILLNPILQKSNLNEISNETALLKKYLRKFKYNYFKYFYRQYENVGRAPTPKEINIYSLKVLFLLAGI